MYMGMCVVDIHPCTHTHTHTHNHTHSLQFAQLPLMKLRLEPVHSGAGFGVGPCGHDLPLLPRRSFYAVIAGCELGIAVGHMYYIGTR